MTTSWQLKCCCYSKLVLSQQTLHWPSPNYKLPYSLTETFLKGLSRTSSSTTVCRKWKKKSSQLNRKAGSLDDFWLWKQISTVDFAAGAAVCWRYGIVVRVIEESHVACYSVSFRWASSRPLGVSERATPTTERQPRWYTACMEAHTCKNYFLFVNVCHVVGL